MIELLLFDLDGVLIDSKDNMKQSWMNVCCYFNIDVPFELYFQQIGKPFENIMEELKLTYLLPEIKEKYFYYTKMHEDLISFYPNVIKILKTLEKNYKIGIVTSKIKSRTNEILSKVDIKFSAIQCPEEGYRGKPESDLLIKTINELQIEASKTVYFGDMIVDKLSAENARTKFIQCGWGYSSTQFCNSCIFKIDDITKVLLDIEHL